LGEHIRSVADRASLVDMRNDSILVLTIVVSSVRKVEVVHHAVLVETDGGTGGGDGAAPAAW